jgi:hypothetical protein
MGIFERTERLYTVLSEVSRQPSVVERWDAVSSKHTKVTHLVNRSMAGNENALAKQGSAVYGKDERAEPVQQGGETPSRVIFGKLVFRRRHSIGIRGRAIS